MRSWTRSGALDRQRADFDEGANNHLMLNVNRYDEARRFYAPAESRYPNQTAFAEEAPKRGSGWYNDAGSVGCRRQSHVFAQISSIGIAWDSAKSLSPPTVAARWMNSRRKSSGTAAR